MKRLFRFVFRLLLFAAIVAALILIGVLVVRVDDLSTQIDELTARVQRLEDANAARPAPGSQAPPPSRTQTATRTPRPTRTATRTQTTTADETPAPTATPGPTRTPRPTNTPRPTRTPTRTATATPVPTPYFIVNSDWVNVRTGPGPEYPVIDSIPRDEQFDIGARNPSGTWLEFCCVKEQRGWIYAPLLNVSVDVTVIPTVRATPTVPPSPTFTPSPPTSTPVPPAAPPTDGLGLWIGPENRCSHYDSDLYPYSQSVEPHIVNQQGGRIYGPYTGTYFSSIRETDIEHIVARSEAHDSGLCAADSNTRRAFASDLLNLTLASPSVNRHQKVDNDLAEWLPAMNQCWYVNRVVQVKRKYNLSMDQAEANTARRVLASCPSTQMIFTAPGARPAPTATTPSGQSCPRNCTEAHAMGMSNMGRDHACYQSKFDRDRDGIGCER